MKRFSLLFLFTTVFIYCTSQKMDSICQQYVKYTEYLEMYSGCSMGIKGYNEEYLGDLEAAKSDKGYIILQKKMNAYKDSAYMMAKSLKQLNPNNYSWKFKDFNCCGYIRNYINSLVLLIPNSNYILLTNTWDKGWFK